MIEEVSGKNTLDKRQEPQAAHDGARKDIRLDADQIRTPKPQLLERLLGGYFRRKGEKFIGEAIKEYAVVDGAVDNEVADFIRKDLTRRVEASLHRDVLEPTGWVGISGLIMGGAALGTSKHLEGKALTPKSAMAAVTGVALGSCLDFYRVKRRFESGLNGALSGALHVAKEARDPRWAVRQEEDHTLNPDISPAR